MESLTEFLEKRCQTLEQIEARTKDKSATKRNEPDKPRSKTQDKATTLANLTNAGRCYLCHAEHLLYQCDKFLVLSIDERIKKVRRLKLCLLLNCLRNDHFVKTCKMGSCRECSGRHNTLCHHPVIGKKTQKEESSNKQTVQEAGDKPSGSVTVHHATGDNMRKHILMATAIVNAKHPNESNIPLRILLNSASKTQFITQAACNRLGVKRDKTSKIVTEISGIKGIANLSCEGVIQSRYSNIRAAI